MKLLVLLPVMFLTACSTSVLDREVNDTALCRGLIAPTDKFAETVIRNSTNTPEQVIIDGTALVKTIDAGCN